jgi:hypothetical protein
MPPKPKSSVSGGINGYVNGNGSSSGSSNSSSAGGSSSSSSSSVDQNAELLQQLLRRRAERLKKQQEAGQAIVNSQQQAQQQQQQQQYQPYLNGSAVNGTATAATDGSSSSSSSSSTHNNSIVPISSADSLTSSRDDAAAGAMAVSLQRKSATVRFWLKFKAEWGQRLKVVGTHEELGVPRLWPLPACLPACCLVGKVSPLDPCRTARCAASWMCIGHVKAAADACFSLAACHVQAFAAACRLQHSQWPL